MILPSQEGEIPIPINSSFGGVVHPHNHMIHHDPTPQNHIIPTSTPANGPISTNGPLPTTLDDSRVVPYKRMVKYRECQKNHAASMGGNATDGCGEFMPSGEEGTIEALTCSACHCHRNFHRKEIEGDPSICEYFHHNPHLSRAGRKVILGHHKNILSPEALGYHHSSGPIRASGPVVGPHNQMIMSYNLGPMPSESDEDGGGGGMMARPAQMVKKRFRTKFSQEQKEKMLNFAEKVGWKIQKQEETMVQQFCQEIGVKRRVLKVWMHNNKHNLAKKNALPASVMDTESFKN